MSEVQISVLDGNASPVFLVAEDEGLSGATQRYAQHVYDQVLGKLTNYETARVYITGTVSTSGNNTLVAAPGASNAFRILHLELFNESTTETLAILRSGTATDRRRSLLAPKGSFGSRDIVSYPLHAPMDLAENAAIVLNLNGPNTVGYNITYLVRTV